jgi:hypothetical protein
MEVGSDSAAVRLGCRAQPAKAVASPVSAALAVDVSVVSKARDLERTRDLSFPDPFA